MLHQIPTQWEVGSEVSRLGWYRWRVWLLLIFFKVFIEANNFRFLGERALEPYAKAYRLLTVDCLDSYLLQRKPELQLYLR